MSSPSSRRRKKLIVAGISTKVCVAFVALSAIKAGYEMYAVIDASGTWNKLVQELAFQRMVEAGVVPITCVAIGAELQGDWRSPSAAKVIDLWTGDGCRIVWPSDLYPPSLLRRAEAEPS